MLDKEEPTEPNKYCSISDRYTTHEPMLIYTKDSPLFDAPICRRCGQRIEWDSKRETYFAIIHSQNKQEI